MSKDGRVGIELGITYNVGSFESLRVAVSLHEDVVAEAGDTREDVFAALAKEAEERVYLLLRREIEKWKSDRPMM